MKFTNAEELKSFLKHSGLRPKDYLGQNFLVDEDALNSVVTAAELNSDDTVLEIGPGLGVLTEELVKRAGRVIAVEKDRNLIPLLRRSFKKFKNIEIINEDILSFHVKNYISGTYKVVANIPYYLTSKLIQNFLEIDNTPEVLVFMVQKEVGERAVARAGELSILGISVQIYGDAEIVKFVPKQSFWPVPKVDSVVIRIKPRNKYPEITDKRIFFRILKIAFAGKRKQIHNSLVNGLQVPKEKVLELLNQAAIPATARPQDLEIGDWVRLYLKITDEL